MILPYQADAMYIYDECQHVDTQHRVIYMFDLNSSSYSITEHRRAVCVSYHTASVFRVCVSVFFRVN